jgi:hypothetical protein
MAIREDLLGQAVGEPLLVLRLAEVGERQHGDGLGRRGRGGLRGRAVEGFVIA